MRKKEEKSVMCNGKWKMGKVKWKKKKNIEK